MSIAGWYMWSKKNPHAIEAPAKAAGPGNPKPLQAAPSTVNRQPSTLLKITASTKKEWLQAIIFFFSCWMLLYLVLKHFTDSTVPIADSFTSGAAFTGMWLMNKKKLENWTWWIITDLASVPLNFYKHLVFTSFQYLIFLILAIMGYITWRKKILHGDT
jgi:nicotinamide mononucleotide transporter PnuC